MRDYDPTTGRYPEADPLGLALMHNTTLTPTTNSLIGNHYSKMSTVDASHLEPEA